MELILDEKYKIVTDKYNFILQKYEDVVDRKTKEITGQTWKDVGYFGGNFNEALKKYANERIRDQDTLYIDGLMSKLNELHRHIDKVVKKENIVLVGNSNE